MNKSINKKRYTTHNEQRVQINTTVTKMNTLTNNFSVKMMNKYVVSKDATNK